MQKSNQSFSHQLQKYDIISKIGEGTYGLVYKGQHKTTGKIVALKKVRLDPCEDGCPVTALREISLLKEFQHPNVVKLEEVIYNTKQIYMVFEYLDTDLYAYLHKIRSNPHPELARSYFKQLLTGLSYLHRFGVLHRDLKPQNILIDQTGRLVLCDFGMARVVGVKVGKCTHEVQTLWYRAPEVLLGGNYNSTVDIWACACIFYELITRNTLFAGDSEIDQLFKIFKIVGTPNENIWPQVTSYPDFKSSFPKWKPSILSNIAPLWDDATGFDLFSKMLILDPAKRMSAQKALEHPYFYGA